ncbi:hypothetical protein F0562_007825 [Nyssa sinensis]|uniref:Uncharacterized protein n=1 Tax=Nyssa sinensis TaxID=561372 RepID=A0A5J5A4P6_9ASTE|nr:hypothetical protein F0562_007825 [Nyssa sinensis]
MKASCTLLASVLAASTVALSSSSSSSSGNLDVVFNPSSNEGFCSSYCSTSSSRKGGVSSGDVSCTPSSVKEKFAPRFDGLKFIETLVTAHR